MGQIIEDIQTRSSASLNCKHEIVYFKCEYYNRNPSYSLADVMLCESGSYSNEEGKILSTRGKSYYQNIRTK